MPRDLDSLACRSDLPELPPASATVPVRFSWEASRVSAGMSLAKAGRRLTGTAVALFGLVLLSGCDPDPYPTDLSYPLRTDLVLIRDYEEAGIPAAEPLGNVETMI